MLKGSGIWTKAMRMWNAGCSKQEFIEADLENEHEDLEKEYGCKSIPLTDVYGPMKPTIINHTDYFYWR